MINLNSWNEVNFPAVFLFIIIFESLLQAVKTTHLVKGGLFTGCKSILLAQTIVLLNVQSPYFSILAVLLNVQSPYFSILAVLFNVQSPYFFKIAVLLDVQSP